MDIKFLNVDLELESKQDISVIIQEFGEDVFVLYQGIARSYHQGRLEIADNSYNNADDIINEFCFLVEALPKDIRQIWDNCCLREFNIGYESGMTPISFRSDIKSTTIQRIANIGASLVITIYPIH